MPPFILEYDNIIQFLRGLSGEKKSKPKDMQKVLYKRSQTTAKEQQQQQQTITYRNFFYNFPHRLAFVLAICENIFRPSNVSVVLPIRVAFRVLGSSCACPL